MLVGLSGRQGSILLASGQLPKCLTLSIVTSCASSTIPGFYELEATITRISWWIFLKQPETLHGNPSGCPL